MQRLYAVSVDFLLFFVYKQSRHFRAIRAMLFHYPWQHANDLVYAVVMEIESATKHYKKFRFYFKQSDEIKLNCLNKNGSHQFYFKYFR